MIVRSARAAELPLLQDIEVAAGRCFRDVDMAEIASDEPLPLDALDTYRRAGRAWIAVDTDRPVAYVLTDVVDGNAHVEQVSVHPDHAGRRIGRALLEHVADLARVDGVPAVTLTTFVDVPWNGPYYARCGFRRLADADLAAGLRAIRAHEAARGLDRWPRAAMIREL